MTRAVVLPLFLLSFALTSLLSVAIIKTASASTDPSSCYGGADFSYSQAFQLDLSSDIEEDEQQLDSKLSTVQGEDSDSQLEQFERQRPVVKSELLYESEKVDGCSFVSSRTVAMESAAASSEDDGDGVTLWLLGQDKGSFQQNEATPLLFHQHATLDVKFDVDVDSDDDDDDDDDNDGHSSMLSNASLRQKSVVAVGISGSSDDCSSSLQRRGSGESSSSAAAALSPRSAPVQHVALRLAVTKLRGGGGGGTDFRSAAASVLQSEISKKLFVTALVTLVFEAVIGHILEFLKIVMQTASGDDGTTYAKVIRSITAEKGIAGLWDGFCPWGVVQAVSKGAVFGLAHASALTALVPLAERGVLPMALALTIAGGIGGGFQGYVLSPTLLLKTRVMTNPVFREKMSVLRTTLLSFRIGYDVVKTEGLSTLMKGANVFATKRVFDWASRYFFADLFEALFATLHTNGQPLSVAEKSASSLLGGVCSTLITLPLDVLVAKTQDAKKAGVKVSALKLFQDELREKGLSGLRNAYMRGFEARLLHVCLTTLVIKTGTPIAYEALFGSTAK